MQTATKSVEFSFNNVMYRQILIDGAAIGSLLDPALANVFVRFYKSLELRFIF